MTVLFGMSIAGCSSEELPPTPSAVQAYIEATDSERDLLNSANTANNSAWATFVDSSTPGFLGIGVNVDSEAASEARAAANTLERRAENLSSKLQFLNPPQSCQSWHILLEEYADGVAASASARQSYIADAIGRQLNLDNYAEKVNTSVAQVNQLTDEINAAVKKCR